MRHRYNKLKTLNTGVQKKENVIRNLLTSLVVNGQLVTTPKRAKVLKAQADKFFSDLVKITKRFEDQSDARREVIRAIKSVIFTEVGGKKVLEEILPKYIKEDSTGYVQNYKLGFRPGDATEKILVKLK